MVYCFERSLEGLHSKRSSTYWSRVLGLRGQTEGQVPGQGGAEVMRAISKPLRQDRSCELSGLSGVRISPGEGEQKLTVGVDWDGKECIFEIDHCEVGGARGYLG